MVRRLGTAVCGAALAAATIGAGACSRFVSTENMYPKVEDPIGEVTVRGADTLYALEQPGWRLVASSRRTLRDARPVLGDVARAFRRLLGEAPPRLDVAVLDSADRAAYGADGARDILILPEPRLRGASDREDPRQRAFVAAALGRTLALAVAQRWVSAYADARLGAASESPRGAAPHDGSASGAAGTGGDPSSGDAGGGEANGASANGASANGASANGAPARAVPPGGVPPRPLDPRMAPWLQVGLLALMTDQIADARAAYALSGKEVTPVPLDSLLRWQVPDTIPAARLLLGRAAPQIMAAAAGGAGRRSLPRGGRRGERLDGIDLLVAQATSFVYYLTDRRGGDIAGRIAAPLAAGRSLPEALAAATGRPASLQALEDDWRSWLETQVARRR
jgi:hypothetical protein